MKRKILILSMILAIMIGLLQGCGSTTKEGKEKSITAANTADLSTLDSSLAIAGEDMTVITNEAEGLYRSTHSGFELAAADSVKVSDDKLTYTFTIRNTKWSDGSNVTAYDFEYAWKRLADPKSGAEYSYMVSVAGIKNADAILAKSADVETLGVKATDEKTLVVQLDHVVPYLNSVLAGTYFVPIKKEFAEKLGDKYGLSKDNILSNGPFIVTDWTVGGSDVTLSKNKNYWDAANVKIDKLTFKTIKDSQSGLIAYQSGALDYVGISGDLVAQYKNSNELKTSRDKFLYYFQPNTTNSDLANKNLRLALALSYNKTHITDNILKDGSIPANFFIVNMLSSGIEGKTYRDAANKTFLEENKSLALEYFNKAKQELDKDKFNIELLHDDDTNTSEIAQFFQSEIQTNLPGVTITLKSQPKKNRMQIQKSGDFQLAISRWGADYDDPSTYFDLFKIGSTYNYGKWNNSDYDKLVKSASNELLLNPQERLNAYIKAEQIIMDDAAILPIYQKGSAFLLKSNVTVEKNTDDRVMWRTSNVN